VSPATLPLAAAKTVVVVRAFCRSRSECRVSPRSGRTPGSGYSGELNGCSCCSDSRPLIGREDPARSFVALVWIEAATQLTQRAIQIAGMMMSTTCIELWLDPKGFHNSLTAPALTA